MTTKLNVKLRRIGALGLLALVFTGTEARADFYIAPSIGVGYASHQFDTKALGAPGRIRDRAQGRTLSAGLAIGHRTHIGNREVDLELEVRASAAERYRSGTRTYDVSRQQIGVAIYTTVHRNEGFRAQVGIGAGARRLDITLRHGAASRRDVDREPYGMLSLRGLWEIDEGRRGFAELRYSAHPTPKRAGGTASLEHEMDKVALHFGVQIDLGAQ
jgi:hypothetical protein